jgi:hypothetical protein
LGVHKHHSPTVAPKGGRPLGANGPTVATPRPLGTQLFEWRARAPVTGPVESRGLSFGGRPVMLTSDPRG